MSDFNIPAEVKTAILSERINALNAEGYQHELNLKQFERIGAETEAQQSRDAIDTIKAALAVCAEELES